MKVSSKDFKCSTTINSSVDRARVEFKCRADRNEIIRRNCDLRRTMHLRCILSHLPHTQEASVPACSAIIRSRQFATKTPGAVFRLSFFVLGDSSGWWPDRCSLQAAASYCRAKRHLWLRSTEVGMNQLTHLRTAAFLSFPGNIFLVHFLSELALYLSTWTLRFSIPNLYLSYFVYLVGRKM